MIKVLHLTRNLGIGGLEKVIFDICSHIDRTKFDVRVCCLHWKGDFGEQLENMGIPVDVLPNSKEVDYFGSVKIARYLRQHNPDIIHTHNSHAFIDGTLGSILARQGTVIHTDHARNFPDKKRIMVMERWMAKHSPQIAAVSEDTRDNLVKYIGIPRDKITVIYNGIDPAKYAISIDRQKKIKELGITGNKKLIGLGVRLTEQKGLVYLLSAVEKLAHEFPELCLILAGKGELREHLEEEAQRLGITRNIKFLGARLDWNEILQLLDIYVLPSVWEGLPLAVLEAMAARKPIVATAVGGNPSAIVQNHSGLLVPSKNPEELYLAIRRLLLNKNLADKYANNAYQRFLELFTVEKMARNYEGLYQDFSKN